MYNNSNIKSVLPLNTYCLFRITQNCLESSGSIFLTEKMHHIKISRCGVMKTIYQVRNKVGVSMLSLFNLKLAHVLCFPLTG